MAKQKSETETPLALNSDVQSSYQRKWYHVYTHCSSCFAKDDMHDMNCIECCPVKNEEVEKVMYANQDELFDKKVKAFRKALHG